MADKEYNVKADKEILEGIKKLNGYTCKVQIDGKEETQKPVIVLAPKLKEPGKESTALRIYAYGGLIGEIPTTKNAKGKLEDEDYLKYLSDNSERGELKRILTESKNQTKEQRLETLFSDEYLTWAVKACLGKFTQKKERSIETKLVKKYLANSDTWIPIDIEFQFSEKWLDKGKKRGKPDITIYDKRVNAFRFIELKCNKESCTGSNSLYDHYWDAMKIINSSYRSEIVSECFRKMGYLYEYGIISGEEWKAVLEKANRDEVGLQFGFFFVGGDVKRYKNEVKMQLNDTDKNCSFLYASDIDADTLKNCQLLSYDEFIENEYTEN